jgi:hypothetical protein
MVVQNNRHDKCYKKSISSEEAMAVPEVNSKEKAERY